MPRVSAPSGTGRQNRSSISSAWVATRQTLEPSLEARARPRRNPIPSPPCRVPDLTSRGGALVRRWRKRVGFKEFPNDFVGVEIAACLAEDLFVAIPAHLARYDLRLRPNKAQRLFLLGNHGMCRAVFRDRPAFSAAENRGQVYPCIRPFAPTNARRPAPREAKVRSSRIVLTYARPHTSRPDRLCR